MRWLGQMQRSFDLMCSRLVTRQIKGDKGPQPLGNSQLMQKHVFDSYCDIQSSRLMTLHAASKIDRGDYARVEIAAIKVFGAHALHRVVDRCVQ
jgi:acyl-CoA dehydrogenase